jgi:predicted ester cyclase
MIDEATLRASKQRFYAFLNALPDLRGEDLAAAAALHMAPDMAWNAQHPTNTVHGPAEWVRQVWTPLTLAFPDIERRDDIFLCGESNGHAWISTTGHYAGTFAGDYCGIPATGHLATLRFGEFHRIAEGRIAESFVMWDLVGLMEQAGVNPLPPSAGIAGFSPPPMTLDGVRPHDVDAAGGRNTEEKVMAMIAGLLAYDGKTLESMAMERYWHDTMMWYGPAGIGSNRKLSGFQDFHQRPFLEAFPDRRGGDHKARVGDGNYFASTGWPSVRATHTGPYLGQPATHRAIGMRVMDWWRLEGTMLRENWVFIDLPELFLQFDRDLFAEMAEKAAARGQ